MRRGDTRCPTWAWISARQQLRPVGCYVGGGMIYGAQTLGEGRAADAQDHWYLDQPRDFFCCVYSSAECGIR